jgi:cytochrome c
MIYIILTTCATLCFTANRKNEQNRICLFIYSFYKEVRMKISAVGGAFLGMVGIASLAWIGFSSEPSFAQGAKLDGKALYEKSGCVACHGADGKKTLMPTYPKLAGQNSAYALAQMKDIRDGKRVNGQSAVMKPILTPLKDDVLKAIADYLEKLH